MNSAIQCLSNTIELTHYFVEKEFVNDFNGNNVKYSALSKEYYRLISGV